VKHIHDTPLILVGKMWAELVEWARKNMLRPELALAGSEDLTIPRCVNTAEEAIALIREHHARWTTEKSSRKPNPG